MSPHEMGEKMGITGAVWRLTMNQNNHIVNENGAQGVHHGFLHVVIHLTIS